MTPETVRPERSEGSDPNQTLRYRSGRTDVERKPNGNPASRGERVKWTTLVMSIWALIKSSQIMTPETVRPERSEGSDPNQTLRYRSGRTEV